MTVTLSPIGAYVRVGKAAERTWAAPILTDDWCYKVAVGTLESLLPVGTISWSASAKAYVGVLVGESTTRVLAGSKAASVQEFVALACGNERLTDEVGRHLWADPDSLIKAKPRPVRFGPKEAPTYFVKALDDQAIRPADPANPGVSKQDVEDCTVRPGRAGIIENCRAMYGEAHDAHMDENDECPWCGLGR